MNFAIFIPACLPLWITMVASHVAPPTNVMLNCRNFRNVLKWSYPENTTGVKFEVDIGSYQGSYTGPKVETPDLHADVSFLNHPSDGYFVTVTAVVGGNKSEPAPSEDGITFSYYQDSQVEQKCFLDLPPVNITVQRDNKVQISFVHPFEFHRRKPISRTKKPQKKKSNQDEIPAVNFKVTRLNETGKPHSFTCQERVCNETLPVDPDQQSHCLNITGEIMQGPLVKPTQLYCSEPFKEPLNNLIIVYIVSALLAVATIGFILFMVYQKITKPSISLTKILVINKSPTSVAVTESVAVDKLECELVPSSPTPLLSETEGEDKTEFMSTCNSSGYDMRLPIGVPSENGAVSDVTQEGHPNEEGPCYMAGNLDEDDETSSTNEATSGYEKRSTVLVDLGQDEMAKGYRG